MTEKVARAAYRQDVADIMCALDLAEDRARDRVPHELVNDEILPRIREVMGVYRGAIRSALWRHGVDGSGGADHVAREQDAELDGVHEMLDKLCAGSRESLAADRLQSLIAQGSGPPASFPRATASGLPSAHAEPPSRVPGRPGGVIFLERHMVDDETIGGGR